MHLTSVASTAAGTTAAAVPQPRLVKAAHEFEAQMVHWASMHRSP